MKSRILVSACLIGNPVRYNGRSKLLMQASLAQWQLDGRLVPICPELSAGFGVPRPAAEIAEGKTGAAVLAKSAHVIEASGTDLTPQFIEGAHNALARALSSNCKFALLADGSPSCGSSFIYDGSFTGNRHEGVGVTTALLQEHGISVFSESQLAQLKLAVENEHAT